MSFLAAVSIHGLLKPVVFKMTHFFREYVSSIFLYSTNVVSYNIWPSVQVCINSPKVHQNQIYYV